MGRHRSHYWSGKNLTHGCRPAVVQLVPLVFIVATSTNHTEAQISAAGSDAQAVHQRGVEAFATGDLEAARSAFREALASSPRPSTAFNLALVLRVQGEPGEARTLVGKALAQEFGTLSERERIELDRLAHELSQEVAELAVRGYGAASILFRVDDEQTWTAPEGEQRRVFVEPGEHRITASAEERARVHAEVSVGAGGLRVVSLRLLAPAVSDARTANLNDNDSSPWPLALAIGGGVAAAIAAVILVAVLSGQSDPEPDIVIPL